MTAAAKGMHGYIHAALFKIKADILADSARQGFLLIQRKLALQERSIRLISVVLNGMNQRDQLLLQTLEYRCDPIHRRAAFKQIDIGIIDAQFR